MGVGFAGLTLSPHPRTVQVIGIIKAHCKLGLTATLVQPCPNHDSAC
jgi:hypothetical protein